MVKYKRDALSKILLAMGDPTRREILKKVSQGELSVLEIAESFPISLPAISKHLKVLERAGLLSRKREGRVHRFKLIGRPMRDAYEWVRNYQRFWQVQFDSLEAYLEKAKKEGRSHGKKIRRKKSFSKNRSNL